MFFRKTSIPANVTAIAALGLLAGIAMSWPLWNVEARDSFPVLPLWGGYLEKSLLTGRWPAFLLVLLTLSVIARPTFKWLLAGLCGYIVLLCVIDLNRLQPWVWFYLLIFTVVCVGKKETEVHTATALRWLLAAVYFWGGFNKLTPYFAEDNFPWFCDAFLWTKPAGQYPLLGYAIALLEMTLAAGLLLKNLRPSFRWVIIGFHGLITLFLWKLDWNLVVIPWNAAMAAMAWALCPTPDAMGAVADATVRSTRFFSRERWVAGLAWTTPLLHFFYLWPHPLSWEMYTNTQPEATFYVESGRLNCTREMDEMWSALSFDDHTKLLLDDWATKELHVPMFASENTFRQAGAYIDRHVCPPKDQDSASLFILTVNRWDESAEKMIEISGKDLINK